MKDLSCGTNEVKQCLLCNSYIKEIKRMSERNRALQRQIDAFKELLTSKGVMLNEGEDDDEWRKAELPPYKLDEDGTPIDNYDYAADDMNFDTNRERRIK